MTTFGQDTVIRLWVDLLTVLSNLQLPSPESTGFDLLWVLQACLALVIFGAAAGFAAGLYVVIRAGVVRKLAPQPTERGVADPR